MARIDRFVKPHKVANYLRWNSTGKPMTVWSPRIANKNACKCYASRTGLWQDRLGRTWYFNYFLDKAWCLTYNGMWCKMPCITVPLDSLKGARCLHKYAPFLPLQTKPQTS